MNILILSNHLKIGGITQYIISLARALSARKIRVIVASGGGEMERELSKGPARHVEVDLRTKCECGPKVFRAIPRLARLVREEKIDLIHAHTRVTQVVSAVVSAMTRVPYISTCHGFFRPRIGRRLCGCWGSKVIAISGPVAKHLTDDFHIKTEDIALIHTGVDSGRFAAVFSEEELNGLRSSLRLRKAPVVGTIGRFSPVKGHRFFIEAFRKVVAERPDAQGIIVGQGPEEEDLRQLIRRYNLGGSFRLAGSTPHTAMYLALLDIFVFPSVQEGLGLSLLEAMASGRPCVASRIGGVSDIIRDGETGLLVPAQDPDALGGAMIRLLGDPLLGRKLGENARRSVARDFSLETMVEKVLRLYNEVVDSHRTKKAGPRIRG